MHQQVKEGIQNSCKITLANVKSGDCVSYSLVLIKGFAHRNNSQECVSNINNNNNSQNVISVRNADSTGSETEWPVVGSQFKCVVHLHRGYNEIILKYGDVLFSCVLELKPRRTAYRVMPLYIICSGHNGSFQAPETEDNSIQSACKRIAVGAKIIQCITAEKLNEAGFGRKVFQLESDLNSQAAECLVFYSRLHVEVARKMPPGDLWEYFGRELMASSLGSVDRKFLAFLSCTHYLASEKKPKSHDEILAQVEAHVALGGGGLALFGTACLHTWPQDVKEILSRVSNTAIIDSRYFMDDSCYRGTYGGCFATTLGSVCHELGHTFDLGHTETGIMGRGFDNVDLVFTLQPRWNDNENQDRGSGKNVGRSNKSDVQHATVQFTKELSLSYSVNSGAKLQCRVSGEDKVTKLVQNTGPESKCENNSTQDVWQSDETYWGTSCATLLAYHRWFNTEVPQNGSAKLSFDETRNVVASNASLCVVELRDETGLVLTSWQFPEASRTTEFHVSVDSVSGSVSLLVAEDCIGNIIKKKLSC